MMNFITELNKFSLAFSLQDVDHVFEYVIVLNKLCEEISYQMETELAEVYQLEDETGFYLMIKFETIEEELNFMDLFIDLLGNPELELDLDHLQLYTNNAMLYQRLNNAKMQHHSNMIMDLFENTYDAIDEKRLIELESVVAYNAVPSLRKILNVLVEKMENYGIEGVGMKVNEVSQITWH